MSASHWVIMGVSGVGKTAVGKRVATRLGYAFADADTFHPPANVAKMSRGEPLTDADREPWLSALAAWLAEQHAAGRSSVLACSALKRTYRDTLTSGAPHVGFVHLTAPREALLERMRKRKGEHFMPPALLDSQLQTLEPLRRDEVGITIDATGPVRAVAARLASLLAAENHR